MDQPSPDPAPPQEQTPPPAQGGSAHRPLVHIPYPDLVHYSINDLKIQSILEKLVLYLSKEFDLFATSVVEKYSSLKATYNIYIEYPCDLGKIQQRLLGRSPIRYKYVGQILRDFELIATNCEIFNHKNPSFLANAVRFREYYYWILPKMLSRVGIDVTGSYKDMVAELARCFPLHSPMYVDGALYPISATEESRPTEDSVSLMYAHMKQLPEQWQSALVWGVILISDGLRKHKITGVVTDVDITDAPEAYQWLRGQIMKYQGILSGGVKPSDIPTWQEEARLVDGRECEEENTDSDERDEGELCVPLGMDQLSLPEISDNMIETKEETTSRRRRR